LQNLALLKNIPILSNIFTLLSNKESSNQNTPFLASFINIALADTIGGDTGGGTLDTCVPFHATSIYIIKADNKISGDPGDGVSFYKTTKYVNLSREQIDQEFIVDKNNPNADYPYTGADELLEKNSKTQAKSAGEDTLLDIRGDFLNIDYFKNELGNEKCVINTNPTNITTEINTDYFQNGMYIYPVVP
jgi:hypothetical protein